MKKTGLACAALILSLLCVRIDPVTATGDVNPATLVWTSPTTHIDGTPLDDLAGFVVRLSSASGGPYTDAATVAAASPAPAPDTEVVFDLRTLTLTAGQYYVVVTAFDTADASGPPTAEVPFEMVASGDTQAPVLIWGAVTSGKSPTLTVGAHDETALKTIKVFVNGALATTAVTNLQDWQTTVALGRSKSSTVRLEAMDAAGHLTSESRTFRR